MTKYEVEITKRLMKTIEITVPDCIPLDDIKEWVEENDGDLFDIEKCEGVVNWTVDDLVDGEKVKMTVTTTFDDHEFESESFILKSSTK